MTRKTKKKILSYILSMMLIVAMACITTGCNGDVIENPLEGSEMGETTEAGSQEESVTTPEFIVMGEGDAVFMFTVVDADGLETNYEIHTDKEMVGEALLELDLIAGEVSEYGLYVKTVAGTTVDYETDGKYWAFYINGEYAMTGVDVTPIIESEVYTFKVE